ncbi:MAG TPA: AmmeMemoRadiSam system protein A [Anaeromyxobacteraceae bacterium]|nr:AmmeMemoRadiSam system protein A [Anaeromyxobacteraceae bacterium]
MTAPASLTAAEKAALLGIARGTVLHLVGAAAAPPPLPTSGPLSAPRGAFVTLHVDGRLRGCIGTFSPRGSLAETVAAMARAAATEDPRFPRLAPDELPGLSLSVSVLGLPHLLEDRSRIEVGVHGLLVRRDWNRGVLLPKVAVEEGWDGPTFLKHACLKAGLPAAAARDPGLVVEVFEAEEFGEEQPS